MMVPRHIAVIMDGNGRWAKKRGLPRTAGHRQGVRRIKEIVREAKRIGAQALTIFAFSTENWDRPKKEIDFLFSYIDRFLSEYKKELIKEDICLRMIGRDTRINKGTLKKIREVESLTKNHKSFFFNIALDYGGRWDILEAVSGIVSDCLNQKLAKSEITEKVFSDYLSLKGIPDPDLLIRTSGEQRISNFLLWHLAYTELYFTKTFWPDFDKACLLEAVKAYAERERRYGQIAE